ncbi:hypothetical protein [Lysinibacillus fusiformis]|uniref:hypothetical protein n=1 Tax=Lysinibacillus fusiformis TaxID=28031 RepID=UPI000880A198|nr:hypothetical protein [Lysinibacillus fusiformis]WEA41744.1 hypothetical protein PWJ66_23020 [Lysinibacillus fusiformis]SCX63620.1 hypothetical protein SAMN02787108_03287 [Lysinibacillus fusiformis]SDB46511.1 hypothetical protein SAMN02787070_03482 [Lysinibacillus fusiformis]SFI74035.1 hypothetical protein SAMN02787080_03501 [Lysinibacillus fusiformis]SFT16154.1 hypothetical protein SAMN02787099_03202 [Lysinibacillus fusiformis]
MKKRAFKVVGVQLIPKKSVGKLQMMQQIAEKELLHSNLLIEKLVRPVNKDFEEHLRYEESKSKSTRKFMIIGLMDFQSKGDLAGNIVFNPSLQTSLNVMSELQSLVRTVH